MQTIFIVSSGRSGSKALSEAFVDAPYTLSLHGPDKFEKANCLNYKGKLKSPKKIIINKRKQLVEMAHTRGLHYVENSWFISTFVKELSEVFPDCIIVHLVRDGRDFVRSGMSRKWFTGNKKFLNSESAWTRDHWTPPAIHKDRLSKVCWLWNEQQEVIHSQMIKLPEKNNGGVIHFEKLITEDLSKYMEQWGINCEGPIYMKKVNVTNNYKVPHWSEWNVRQIGKCKKIMGKSLEQHGYKF